jgi:hypothetical protein
LRRHSRACVCIETGLNGVTATTDKGHISHLTLDNKEEEEEEEEENSSGNIRLQK